MVKGMNIGGLYACDGYYSRVHGETIDGCGTVFASGTGKDDIYEEEIDQNYIGTETFMFKKYCPVCDRHEVIVMNAGVVPTLL